MALSEKQVAFAEWEALSEQQKSLQGLPLTKDAWSAENGVPRRTLTNWVKHPEVRMAVLATKERLFEARNAKKAPSPSPTGPLEESLSDSGDTYSDAEVALEAKVRAGDLNAIKLWSATFGKARLEAEARAQASDWTTQDDTTIHQRVLELVPAACLAGFLTDQGWDVQPPVKAQK